MLTYHLNHNVTLNYTLLGLLHWDRLETEFSAFRLARVQISHMHMPRAMCYTPNDLDIDKEEWKITYPILWTKFMEEYSLVCVYDRFEGIYCLHLYG